MKRPATPANLLRPLLLLCVLLLTSLRVFAQTGGEAGIQGTVTDSTGSAIPNATVVATNTGTGTSVTRQSSGAGLFTISPILPGTYTVVVSAPGFENFRQENFSIDALRMTGLNVKMTVGSASSEVTVSSAPPQLESTNAVLGGVLENSTYENLPLQMGSQQRDPTAFAVLLPGVQGGARAPIIGGTGNYLAAVYVDGVPVTTVNQQGDNRVVSNAIPVEAIDQFQVVTSTPGAEYQGAGLINFTLKSGGNGYHGTAAIFVRNTAFDTWGFSSPAVTSKDAAGNTLPAQKPIEHQNEIVGSAGGPIPFTRHKGFVWFTYDRYHGRTGTNPNILTVPTARMRTGDFGELLSTNKTLPGGCTTTGVPCTGVVGMIYDPTSTAACTAANAGVLCRYPYPNNVIPASQLSPIAQKMQSYLPAPTNGNLFNNYLGGVPSGYDNHEIATRLDFDLTSRQRLSYILTTGVRKNVPFTVGGTPAGVVLPLPYTAGGTAIIKPTITDVEHAWQITEHITNQFKFGFNRFSQPVGSLTYQGAGYQAGPDLGITNLPAGQASLEFPGATFGASTSFSVPESPWTSNGASGANQTTVPNTFTLLDNVLLVKGRHALTIGGQIQWLQDNAAALLGPSGIYTIPYSASSTANYIRSVTNGKVVSGTSLDNSTAGFSYASFLLGAASASSIAIQSVSETGGRFRTISPYVQDDWKVTPKLTLNLGLRWDDFSPFHEVQDRWSFLNPSLVNAATGNLGELQFAGNRGAGISCQCRTPVNTWFKNFGPRVGLAYAATPRTILRAGYALVYSLGGGVGGRGGAATGTGATGFNTSANTPAEIISGAGAGPSYYLNNSAAFTAKGIANTNFGGPTYVVPANTPPSAASQTLNTGNYVNAAGSFVTAGAIAYADPYLSGRAPEFSFFNGGIQQAITDNLSLTINYAGTQSHFVNAAGTNPRGLYTNQLDPKYLAALGGVLGSDGATPLLTSKASPANLAILQQNLPGYAPPYASFFSAANTTSSIAQSLVAFPQYSGVTDTWGQNVANINYNSLQVSVAQRLAHGVSFTFNYTWSKNIGDDGTFRSGYDIPAGASSNGVAYHQNRIDRGETLTNVPQNISFFGVYQSPFGTGRSFLVRALAGGWQLSHIATYTSGAPLVVTYAGCNAPNAGTCSPDLNPNFAGSPRRNGSFGRGITAATLGSSISYIDPTAFQPPSRFSSASGALSKIGTAPRTAAYGLHGPGRPNLDISVRRTFPLKGDNLKFTLQADCLNVANHPTFGNISLALAAPGATTSTFGYVGNATGNRDFQFAGRFSF